MAEFLSGTQEHLPKYSHWSQDSYFTEGKKPRQGPRSHGSRAGIITQVWRWTKAQFWPQIPNLTLSFTSFCNKLRSAQRTHNTAAMMSHSHGDSGLPSSSQHQNEPRNLESPRLPLHTAPCCRPLQQRPPQDLEQSLSFVSRWHMS